MDITDADRINWLEKMAKKSHTGVSLDFAPPMEGERGGFRFMRHHRIDDFKSNVRDAIDAAMRLEP